MYRNSSCGSTDKMEPKRHTSPPDGERLDLVTMGMFIIDEIHFPPPRKTEVDILGGAGSYTILGARLFRESPSSRRLGWIVHKGSDFPESVDEHIRSWDTSCSLIETPHRLTTRGWNGYGANENRAFKYLTPKLRIDETQLSDEQVLAKCFHLICTPTRCVNLVNGIMRRREAIADRTEAVKAKAIRARPLFVWEPVPDACHPEELKSALDALHYVDVISPNHQELAAFFGETSSTDGNSLTCIQTQAEHFIKAWPHGKGLIVVRCGEAGCMWIDGNGGPTRLIEPYHRKNGDENGLGNPAHVIDPTGAGNAFLGGLCAGLTDAQASGDHASLHAIQCGLIAASFAIEQVGLPHLTFNQGQEKWNGDFVQRRLDALAAADCEGKTLT